MNLVIDIGNTFCKWAVFEDDKIEIKKQAQDVSIKVLKQTVNFTLISQCIISSTRQKPTDLITKLQKHFPCIWLNHNTKLPFENLYSTPKTLGNDRIALAAAASFEFPNKNVLVIDSGTCITYEILTSDNQYLGGAISPGIEMRFKSLNSFTENLPLVKENNAIHLIGNSTVSSITSGIMNGITQEIEGVINQYKSRFEDLIVVITGGGAIYFANAIKNNFFARPEFIIKGLNYIAKFNT